jgi:glycosyltransferase involved in cell wall biosynthesis
MAATCSGGVKRHIVGQGADPGRVKVVYNGIPENRLDGVASQSEARRMLGVLPENQVICCVAHLSLKKGQMHLINAVAMLKDRFPKLVCLLAGEGDQQSELEQQAVKLGIADRVRLLGFRSDVMSVMNAADVVVLPSVAKEGLGLVLVEAALLEKPTIGSNAPGIDEAIQDGVTGLLVPPGDAKALADALARLLEDPDLCRKLGTAGRERSLDLFSQASMVSGFESVYREMLSLRNRD